MKTALSNLCQMLGCDENEFDFRQQSNFRMFYASPCTSIVDGQRGSAPPNGYPAYAQTFFTLLRYLLHVCGLHKSTADERPLTLTSTNRDYSRLTALAAAVARSRCVNVRAQRKSLLLR